MNLNNLTIKSQESIAKAQMIASSNQQQQIDTSHILKAMMETDENIISFLLKKQDVDPKIIAQASSLINSLPRINACANPSGLG